MKGSKVLVLSIIGALVILAIVGFFLTNMKPDDDANTEQAASVQALSTPGDTNTSSQGGVADLSRKTWSWLGNFSYDGSAQPTTPGAFTLTFNSDKTVTLRTDCSTAYTTYLHTENELTFGEVVTAESTCTTPAETDYFAKIPLVHSFFFTQQEELILRYGSDGIMRLN